jgi:hypothetical protein
MGDKDSITSLALGQTGDSVYPRSPAALDVSVPLAERSHV